MTVHEIKVPFRYWSEGECDGWLPGCKLRELVGEWDEGGYVADDWGHMLINEIQRVSVPGFEDRVFYTRRWRDPLGNEFGKRDLRCKGARAFKLMLKGWRHPFYMGGEYIDHRFAARTQNPEASHE